LYSLKQKQLAVETYFQLRSIRKTIRCLGYPSRVILTRWINEFKETGSISEPRFNRIKAKYSEDQINYAVDYCCQHGMNISKTCRDLGYPCRPVLSGWLDERINNNKKSVLKGTTLKKYSYNDKVVASIRLVCRDGAAENVARETGVSRTSLYNWRKQLIPQGERLIMPDLDNNYEELQDQITDLKKQASDLQLQVHKLRMEKDALEKAAELIKKAKGINLQTLSNCEKAIIIDALRNDYCLHELLELFHMAKSSYFYQHGNLSRPDKYASVRNEITNIFDDSGNTYGYRRIHAMLKRNSITLSEKVVRRIMKEEHLLIKKVRIRKYCSYAGEISEAVPNLLKRNFRASLPNQKWLTDITEFHIPAGKVYLSPLIDCFDGLPVAWTIGTSPSAQLVNTMLDIAIDNLPPGAHPIVHTDRGAHYRWPGWIKRMDDAGLIRSMSKKGCSPDNAACEAFFGRLKNEMFYNHSWLNVTINEFIEILDTYIRWYSTGRIKMSLGAMSPMEYRRSLGLIA
jgi:transposase InsO family protein/transposase-like protein